MKNRRNIVELKYPPENPNDIWLKDGKFYRSTSEGWVVIDSKTEYTSKESMIADNPKGGTIGIDKETGETSIYNDVAKQWSPLSGGGVTSITWLELKDKRDAGKLIPGSLYRITDYQCTTTQENTKSAGHQFDIVLLALSEDKLAEEGWAMMHPTDVYDVTFMDGITKKCYLYDTDADYCNLVLVDSLLGCSEIEKQGQLVIDNINKTISTDAYSLSDLKEENLPYNYFQNSNLSAWKVWYCLDNDKSRFAWADDNLPSIVDEDVTYVRKPSSDTGDLFAWYNENDNIYNYTKTEHPSIGDETFDEEGGTNANVSNVFGFGRGVIYRLIDEFNNDCPYDFKNIQYQLRLDNNVYIDGSVGEYTWVYTFDALNLDTDERTDATLIDRTILIDDGYNKISNNFIGVSEDYNTVTELPYICFLVSWNSDDTYFGIFGNIFNNSSECYFSKELSNVLLIDCHFGSQSRLVTDSSTFYINDKKVLTES